MHMINIILCNILYIVTIITLVLAVYSWKKKEVTGAKPLVLLCLAVSFYTFGYGSQLISSNLRQAIFWGKFEYVGFAAIPAIWVLVAYSISGKTHNKYKIFLLCIIPMLTVIFRTTNEWHHLFYSKETFKSNGYFNVLVLEKGPWDYVNYVFFVLCISFSTKIYYNIYKKEKGFYKKQALILLITSILPLITIIINLLGRFPLRLDSGAFIVIFENFLFVHGVLRYNFIHIIPLSRKKIFDWIYDGVLVIDTKLNLLDYNQVAKVIFPELDKKMTGLPINISLASNEEFISIIEHSISIIEHENLLEKVRDEEEDMYKFSLYDHRERQIKDYKVRITSLKARKNIIGMTVMISDITKENQILKKLEELAQTDYLTGLFNRRRFFDIMTYEIKRTFRLEEPLSLIIFDIDHFKRINDTWGHQAGDRVLKEIAEITKNCVRETDSVARYGGEEFIILLPGILAMEAVQIAERIRKQFENHIINLNRDIIRLTASFGVAQFTGKEFETNYIDKIVSNADQALYKAKELGRNRSEVYFEKYLSIKY